MSTILKALKRVDQTTPPPDDMQSGPPIIDTKEAVKGRVFRIWLQRKMVWVLIFLGVAIGAGWLIYSQKDRLLTNIGSPGRSAKPRVFEAKIEPQSGQSKRPAPQPSTPLNQKEKPGRATSERGRVDTERGRTGSLQPQFGQKNQTKQMTSSAPQARAAETEPVAKPNISRRPGANTGKADQRKTRPLPVVPAKKSPSRSARATRSYQKLDNNSLKLQAIAWSTVASQRIAVINDRIVREGESIEGFSINQIRQEDVIVNDGSQTWQLEFGLR